MIGREYPPYIVGGTGTHTYHLVRALREKNIEVDVVAYGYQPVVEEKRGKVFFIPPLSSIISRKSEAVIKDLKLFYDIHRLISLAKTLLKSKDYDVLHVQEPYVGGLLTHPAKITTIHDTSYGELKAILHTKLTLHNAKRTVFFSTIGYAMEYSSLATSKIIITPSPQVRDELIHVYHASKLAEIVVIPNGVNPPDVNEPSKVEAKREIGFPESLVVFTVAQHIARKRLETLVKAARLLKDKWAGKAVIIVGGAGPLTPWLRKLSTDYGLQGFVYFTGWIPSKKLSAYYQAADVFVLTSEYEAGPITLLEAGIRETALVSTRIPGFPALLKHGENALLYPVGEYRELAKHIDALLSDEALRARLASRARAFAERFTWKRIAEYTIAVYYRASS